MQQIHNGIANKQRSMICRKQKSTRKIISQVPHLFVIPLRLERRTCCLEGSCSIQLSYGTIRVGIA